MAPKAISNLNLVRLGPLDGIRVLDMSRLVAGNMATLQLADFGADVIKVEHPEKSDDLRRWLVDGAEVYWKIYARNKRSITLDVRTEPDRAAFECLIKSAHVLVENFVPGTLEKWGFAPDRLLELNPKLVILRISGWGQTGPYRDKPGFGTLVEAMSGYASLNGWDDRPPLLPPLAMADMVAGLYGANAVLAAIRVAEKPGGRGQVVDLSLFEPIFSLISSEALRYHVSRKVTPRSGNQASHTAPRNIYECSDGRFLALSGSMQSMAERIFDTIGRSDLKTHPDFATNEARVRNQDELNTIIAAYVSKRTLADNLAVLESAGVTVAPVLDMSDILENPYVRAREVVTHLPDAELGSIPMHNIVPRLSETPGGFRRPAPRHGEHTNEILAEIGVKPPLAGAK
ncbi:CoA transferase [Devosia algicola]|uniref:CoA transferase n=1 Tax=Devosia algicola TaxID=3026418 RepID=A0ABY7YQT6_9HYPH|nr:CoA transferase [Devosia algicola]WDR03493.1 CoA transferase [Devosia algicola]